MLDDVLQLHDRHANEAIVSSEAIVFDAYVQFVGGWLFVVGDNEVECLIILGRPCVVLGLGRKPTFLVV